eukprot:5677484-Amphidinium_carterae.1
MCGDVASRQKLAIVRLQRQHSSTVLHDRRSHPDRAETLPEWSILHSSYLFKSHTDHDTGIGPMRDGWGAVSCCSCGMNQSASLEEPCSRFREVGKAPRQFPTPPLMCGLFYGFHELADAYTNERVFASTALF